MSLFKKALNPFSAVKGIGHALGFGGHQKNPADDAMPYLDKIPGMAEDTYNPYIKQGKQFDPQLMELFSSLMKDPNAFYDKLASGYEPSAAYQAQKKRLSGDIGATAAAGGYAGTPEHEQQIGDMSHELLTGDFDKYLQNVMNMFTQGVTGGQGYSDRGYGASKDLMDILGQVLGTKAGLAFEGRSAKNANKNAMAQALLQALAQGGSFAAGKMG